MVTGEKSAVIDLAHLLLSPRDAQSLVALDRQHRYYWCDFCRAVAVLSAKLQQHSAQRWLLADDSSYRFAIGLMALLHSGKTIVLPPNSQPGVLAELASDCDAILGRELPNLPSLALAITPAASEQQASLEPLVPEQCRIEVLTSGSTGKPQRVLKTLASFSSELAVQAQLWQRELAGAVVMATVSHQHIYGLLFRLLLPLACGRPFWLSSHAYPEQLFADIEQLAQPVVLISSPALLARLPEPLDLSAVAAHVRLVVSSGGPLPLAAAQRIARLLGQAPVEVFGSTETGGVGWRRQTQPGQVWQPLAGVKLRQNNEGCLQVLSPYSVAGNWFTMGDRVNFDSEGCFELLGRADRIEKIEEKRLSLTEMEQRLIATEWVSEARLLVLEGRRRQLAAVVVCSEAGQVLLQQAGKRALNEQLKQALLPYFERVLLPRKWRYLDAMPFNSQGKLPQASLAALFTTSAG
jgi:acyl-coenzyme A synthetase/AMP-(fatty) acid ligase